MKKYLITANPSYFQLRKYMPDFALYRNKEEENYAFCASNFIEMGRSIKGMKLFLHQDYLLADLLGATGVHLTSRQFTSIEKAKVLGLEVIVSTHSSEEIFQVKEMGADYVTYSPIFPTPNKGEPKGVEALKRVVSQSGMKIFALGGIVSEKEVAILKDSGAYGFASIRYFL